LARSNSNLFRKAVSRRHMYPVSALVMHVHADFGTAVEPRSVQAPLISHMA
jgi:hypothetical protein